MMEVTPLDLLKQMQSDIVVDHNLHHKITPHLPRRNQNAAPINDRCSECHGSGRKFTTGVHPQKSDVVIVTGLSDEHCEECNGSGLKLNALVKYAVGYQFAIHPKVRTTHTI